MKKKTILMSIIFAAILAACAPAQPSVEVADSAVLEEEMAPVVEEAAPVEEADVPSDAEGVTGEVSFSADVWPIIEQYALNAHGGKGGVFLESYDDIMKQVVPGDPASSMLYKVLTGNGAPQMPPKNPLPEDLIQTIYDWIEQGAKNN
jgi:hypothetical protein